MSQSPLEIVNVVARVQVRNCSTEINGTQTQSYQPPDSKTTVEEAS